MNKNFRLLVCGFILGAAITPTVPAIAKSAQEVINVTYRDIKLCVDGANIDVSETEPFIYNGTTYVPLKAISEAMGKPVKWDGNTSTVYVGNYSDSNGNSQVTLEPYQSEDLKSYSNGESFTVSGVKRANGFVMTGYDSYGLFNLDGKYMGFTFDVGHVDGSDMTDTMLKIYLDGVLALETELKADAMPQNITVPLNGALQMKIVLEGSVYCGKYGFFDLKLY